MADTSRNRTVLGPECKINGDLTLDSDVLVVGSFNGTLRVSGVLEVSEAASINGTIITDVLRSAGTIEADVVVETAIEMSASASLNGRVYTQRLAVADGASFEGQITLGSHAADAAREITSASPAPAPSRPQQSQAEMQGLSDDADGSGVLPRRRNAPFGSGSRLVSNGHHAD